MGLKSTSQLKDFIQVYSSMMSPDLCDSILYEYQHESNWEQAQIGFGTVDTSMRKCKCVDLSMPTSIHRQNMELQIYNDVVKKIISKVSEMYPTLYINHDTGYDLLRYDVGDYYRQHTDHFSEHARSVSCSICLNDDYEGGEFAFFDSDVLYRLNRGDVITFPSNYMFPHEIKPVTKGQRYSIVTWLV